MFGADLDGGPPLCPLWETVLVRVARLWETVTARVAKMRQTEFTCWSFARQSLFFAD